VTVHRVRHARFSKSTFWGRAINMATFQAAAAWRAHRVPRPNIVVTETDPPLLCLLSSLLQRVRGCRCICYLQDIYPDVAAALGVVRDGVKTRLLRRLFFNAYRRSDRVVVLSRDMHDLLVEGGVAADKIETIPNWVDPDVVFPVKENNRFRRVHGLENKFVVMYSGNLGLSQGLEIVVLFVGDGAARANLERLAADKRLANVRFLDHQPKSQLAESLSAADMHLVVLRPEVQRLLMPSKLYGVLALRAGPHCRRQ
jgi:glycosyltransferase involved in cell wall biosynthesis